jgi:hypothetical protein
MSTALARLRTCISWHKSANNFADARAPLSRPWYARVQCQGRLRQTSCCCVSWKAAHQGQRCDFWDGVSIGRCA